MARCGGCGRGGGAEIEVELVRARLAPLVRGDHYAVLTSLGKVGFDDAMVRPVVDVVVFPAVAARRYQHQVRIELVRHDIDRDALPRAPVERVPVDVLAGAQGIVTCGQSPVFDAGPGSGSGRDAARRPRLNAKIIRAGFSAAVRCDDDAIGAVLGQLIRHERPVGVALVIVVLVVLAAGVDDDEIGVELSGPQVHRHQLPPPTLEGVRVPVFPGAQRGIARRQAAAFRSHARFRWRRPAAPDAQLVGARFVFLVGGD